MERSLFWSWVLFRSFRSLLASTLSGAVFSPSPRLRHTPRVSRPGIRARLLQLLALTKAPADAHSSVDPLPYEPHLGNAGIKLPLQAPEILRRHLTWHLTKKAPRKSEPSS